MSQTITVGISDMNVARNGDVLVTHALGSCVGICLYDTVRKIAGLSHILLPSSDGFRPTAIQLQRFANTAIPMLIQRMELQGAKKICMRAKIAGGAQMFAGINDSNLANIGERNVLAVKEVLRNLSISIVAEDTGKNYGRTQYFYSEDGLMLIRSVNRGEWKY